MYRKDKFILSSDEVTKHFTIHQVGGGWRTLGQSEEVHIVYIIYFLRIHIHKE